MRNKTKNETSSAAERFATMIEAAAPFTEIGVTDLEQLKRRLLKEVLKAAVNSALSNPMQRAANEAAALAWLESEPMLVFPTLFEEKARVARQQFQKQRLVRARSVSIIAEAA
ncbi:MAG: hypothetical protein EXS36_14190 [Pedosphaera sp.]|nr:hypothetical protein [Pedosphaera sp.]